MIIPVLVCVVLLLSFANGANDNLKGVATLLGSGTTNYKRALWCANHLYSAWLTDGGRNGDGLTEIVFRQGARRG